MKFSAGIIVLNGMPWMPYLLRSLYPVMDQIVIVEGATLSAADSAAPDGRSTDGTSDAIRAFSDPERKIKLIQKNGFWAEKDDMSAAYAEACTGNYLWQVDSDEFYKQRDVLWIKNYLIEHPDIGAVSFKTLNFFRGLRAVSRGGDLAYGKDGFWRLFKWGKGYAYATHRPPTVHDASGIDTRESGMLYGDMLARRHGIFMYHYTYVLPGQVRDKARYHENLGRGYHGEISHLDWVDEHFERFTPWRVRMDRRPLSWLEPFRGEHPAAVQALIQDAKSGAVSVDLNTPSEITRHLASGWWRLWKIFGMLDAVVWALYDRPVRRLLRPLVRPIRARFFGYRYD